MKKNNYFILPLAGLALAAAPANATILAWWDIWGAEDVNPVGGALIEADGAETGITATIGEITPGMLRRIQIGQVGSDDGTFGTKTLIGADTGVGRLQINKPRDVNEGNGGDFAINITNSTGETIQLDELLFDLEVKESSNGWTYRDYSIVFENTTQGTTSAVLGSATGLPGPTIHDVDIDASAITLASGDVGFFRISLSNADAASTGSATLDNVAITSLTAGDLTPPDPDPMTWATVPAAVSETEITMTASTAINPEGGAVEYRFTNTTAGTNSGWQSNPTFIDTGLSPGTPYDYTVEARDEFKNTTAPSTPAASASTLSGDSNPPPTPAFTTAPTALSFAEITMTAGAVTDPEGNGVEYYFTCTSGGGNDSGWQESVEYTHSGLTPETTYQYTVKSRDLSLAMNESLPSDASPATTPANTVTILASWDRWGNVDANPVPDPIEADFAATGITATISDIDFVLRRLQVDTGSDDGTYGSIQPGADSSVGRMHLNKAEAGDGDFAINITNTGGAAITLDELLFDLEVKSGASDQSHDTYSIVFENMTQGTTSAVLGSATLPAGWNDVDIDASSITLAAGDEGRFVVTLSNGTRTTSSGTLDNFAITSSSSVGGNDFSDWIAGYSVGGQTGIDDDPDGDGVDSGVENFFGTAPDAFTQGLVPGTVNGDTFTFTHPQGTLAGDLTAGYRWSKDLQTFYGNLEEGDGTTVEFTTQPDTPAGYTTVTATVTAGPPPDKLFVDVEVTQP